MKNTVFKALLFCLVCVVFAFVLTGCTANQDEPAPTEQSGEPAPPEVPDEPTDVISGSEGVPDYTDADYIKANADSLFRDKIETFANVANYYSWGHYDISGITDEQKIVLAIVKNITQETSFIAQETLEKTIAEYFTSAPQEYISLRSVYLEADYENGGYSILRHPAIGASQYEIIITGVEVDASDSVCQIICEADLHLYNATGVDRVGESTITLLYTENEYKIADYVQTIYEEAIPVENNVVE